MKYSEDWNIFQKAIFLHKKGDWDGAHDIVQDIDEPLAYWIHAFLHRVEGDEFNANYWYTKAGRTFCRLSIEQEEDLLWGAASK